MRQIGEPSVEEILESIKKVIARDALGDAPASLPGAAAHDDVDPAAEEVLDLGAFQADGTPRDDTADTPAAHRHAWDDDDFNAMLAAHRDPDPAPRTDDPALLGEARSAEMRDSFAALSMLAQPPAPPQIVRSGETSLEGLTRELLRPMLAQWLDANLPPMVERMVAAEIARIAGKKR